jgi:hypothetical protein
MSQPSQTEICGEAFPRSSSHQGVCGRPKGHGIEDTIYEGGHEVAGQTPEDQEASFVYLRRQAHEVNLGTKVRLDKALDTAQRLGDLLPLQFGLAVADREEMKVITGVGLNVSNQFGEQATQVGELIRQVVDNLTLIRATFDRDVSRVEFQQWEQYGKAI